MTGDQAGSAAILSSPVRPCVCLHLCSGPKEESSVAHSSQLIADQSCMQMSILPCVCVYLLCCDCLCCLSCGQTDVMSNGNTLTASCSMFGASSPPSSPMGLVSLSDLWRLVVSCRPRDGRASPDQPFVMSLPSRMLQLRFHIYFI